MTARRYAAAGLIAGLIVAGLGETSIAATTGADWKAGTAHVAITPDKPVWLAGYGHKRVPQGKVHDLWLKALALEDARGRRAVLITSDHQGMPKAMYETIIEKIHERFGLDRRQIMLTFAHNHCGPRLRDDLVDYYPVEQEQVALVDEYSKLVEDMAADAAGRALAALAPASLSAGEGTATFAVNRRDNREAEVPRMLAAGVPLKGPVDHSVPVLAVHDKAGRLMAVVFGYACHPTTLDFT
ncbi:MAG: hypothetical protein GX616_23355, partial [Planctomycetes bacterium]|nr:hypothetical protein [Planctomycetota bacterium]